MHDGEGGNVIGVEQVPDSETHKYGVIAPGSTDGRLSTMTGMVEKPAPGTAPSNLSIAGRYVLQPRDLRGPGRPRDAAPAARSSSPTPWPG